MPDFQNSDVPVSHKIIPDYLKSRTDSVSLARRIQDYYHNRGFTDIRVWVEPELNAFGRKIWGIRSNLVLDFTTLQTKTN